MAVDKSPVLQDRKKLQDVMNDVNKKLGPGSIARASRVAFSHMRRIPTGIFRLDADIGGGLPKGRTTMVVGDESTGKSTLCMKAIASFQKHCRACLEPFEWHSEETIDGATGEVTKEGMVVDKPCPCGANKPHVAAYMDAEGTFDPKWAAALGVDVPTLIVMEPEWAEQGADIMNALVRTGDLDLLIIDSIAMMTPGREVEQSAESGQRPDLALITNRLMRTLQASLNSLGMDNPNKPAIILVNQFRQSIGVMYGDPRTWPGGKGQNFAASILITMRAGKRIDAKGKVGGTDDKKVGVEIHYTVEKNKTFPPHKKGSFKLFFDDTSLGFKKGDINVAEQIIDYGNHLGLLGRGGAWYDLGSVYGADFVNPDEKNGKFQGADTVKEFLLANPDKAKIVKDRILHEVRMNSTGSAPTTPDEEEVDE